MKLKYLLTALLPSLASSLDLVDAYNSALNSSESLAAQEQATLASKSSINVAWATVLPSASYSFDPTSKFSSTSDPRSHNLSITGALDAGSWINIGVQQEKNKVTDLQLVSFKQQFASALLHAYIEILSSDKSLKAALKDQNASSQMVKELKNKFDAGLIARVELVEAQAKYDQVTSQAFAMKANFDLALIKMTQFFSQEIAHMQDLAEDANLEDIYQYLLELSYDGTSSVATKVAEQQFKAASLDHSRLGYSFLPRINYTYTYKDTFSARQDGSYDTNTAKSTTHTLTWQPLNLITMAQEKGLKYSYQAALHQKKLAYIEEQIDKKKFQMNIASLLKQIQAQYHVQNSNKEKLATVRASFDAGTRTTAEVLQAQSLWIDSEKDLFLLKYQCLESLFQYAQSLGLSDMEIVELVNRKLNTPLNVVS